LAHELGFSAFPEFLKIHSVGFGFCIQWRSVNQELDCFGGFVHVCALVIHHYVALSF
jgi:hypothetical protein